MKTGLIGLGAMGAPIARHLHKHGFLSGVWNRTQTKARSFCTETGAHQTSDLSELPEICDLIITCVSRDQDVKAIASQLLPTLKPGSIIVDTSTISPTSAMELAALLKQQQVRFLDAPVTGGVEGAINGQLAMMVGGDSQVLEQCRPVLNSFTRRIEHMGGHGKGQAAKTVNQLMAAGINQAVSQALALAKALALPLEQTIDIISEGAAGNWFLAHRGITMVKGEYQPGFRIALHHKDLLICQQIAKELNVALPIADTTIKDYQRLITQGYENEDISALFRLKDPSSD